MRQKGITLH